MDRIIQGDALTVLKTLPDQCVQTCVTSPPYWGLQDYGIVGQLGLEETPEAYVERMVTIFREVQRALKDDGTLWLNLGDSYSSGGRGDGGEKQRTNKGSIDLGPLRVDGRQSKQLLGMPWRVALALQADGWYLRQDIIWHKPNPMPESVTDRCAKAHEYIFLFSKSPHYYFDHKAISEPVTASSVERLSQRNLEHQRGSDRVPGKTNGPMKAVCATAKMTGSDPRVGGMGSGLRGHCGNRLANGKVLTSRNKRSVWTVTTKPYRGAHFATFPPDLIRPCILAGAPPQYTVLDPFMGSGTTALVAKQLHRHYLGIELNPAYIELARERLGETRLQGVA